mmetsp:Transcript_25632/g.71677  ORF Transcript_25632/g.71677 Transcript_25632/m.71677 type:complete len:283 (+) Transcript_25632:2751-3599(+)
MEEADHMAKCLLAARAAVQNLLEQVKVPDCDVVFRRKLGRLNVLWDGQVYGAPLRDGIGQRVTHQLGRLDGVHHAAAEAQDTGKEPGIFDVLEVGEAAFVARLEPCQRHERQVVLVSRYNAGGEVSGPGATCANDDADAAASGKLRGCCPGKGCAAFVPGVHPLDLWVGLDGIDQRDDSCAVAPKDVGGARVDEHLNDHLRYGRLLRQSTRHRTSAVPLLRGRLLPQVSRHVGQRRGARARLHDAVEVTEKVQCVSGTDCPTYRLGFPSEFADLCNESLQAD